MSVTSSKSYIDITAFRFTTIFKIFSWLSFYCLFINFINFELGILLSNICYIIAVVMLFSSKSFKSYHQNSYLRYSMRVNFPILLYPVIHTLLIISSGTGFNFHTPIVFTLWMVNLIDPDTRILFTHAKSWLSELQSTTTHDDEDDSEFID